MGPPPVAQAHWDIGFKPAVYVEIWIQAIGRQMDGDDGVTDDDLEIAIEYTVTHGTHPSRSDGTNQIDYDWDAYAYTGIDHRKEVNIPIYGHDECSLDPLVPLGKPVTVHYQVREIDPGGGGNNDGMGSTFAAIPSGNSPAEGWGSGTGQLNVWFKRTETVVPWQNSCVCVVPDGGACACPPGFYWDGDSCETCPIGRTWDGAECVCFPETEDWNGQCLPRCPERTTRDSSGLCRPNPSSSSAQSASGPATGVVAMYPPMESLTWDASDANLIDTSWGSMQVVTQMTLAGISDGPLVAQYECVVEGTYAALYVGTFSLDGEIWCVPVVVTVGHAPLILAPVSAQVVNGVGILQANVAATGGEYTIACEGAWTTRGNPFLESIDELVVTWECSASSIA